MMTIDTFAKAMEIYGLLRAKKDPRTESWWNLAMKMDDAPQN
jgi:hypothetical protein